MKKTIITVGFAFFISVTVQAQQENFTIIKNNKGADLGYSPESGIKILTVNGKKFKDLNKNGKLDKYEDWRLSADERAKDLASQMSVEQIAGLMLYSRHQALPAGIAGYNAGTYNGKVFPESNAKAYDLTDQQKAFLKEDNLRHVLITNVESPEVAALWNNQMQAFVEGIGLGIPSNTSTDPRHNATVTAEFNAGAGGTISMWPDGLGMASTFDPKIVEQFGQIAAKEYRALGIATALSPQIDLGSEPRWYRISMTFGESPALTRDMGRAYIDGFQTSYGKDEIKDGWGYKSVNAMVKHWPSGGAEEGGRDGHWAYGKFAVYPGNNLQQHIDPFINGAFKLKGKTSKASAVMPYYTITFDQDKKYNENVANGYSKYIITDLLRDKYGYDGVVCTDWLVTGDEGKTPNLFAGKPWGVENLSINERHYKAIIAGVDQFGGNNDKKPVLEAYQMGIKEFGESFMRARFERSAVRLLKNIFRVGLFENPYLNVAETKAIVGNSEFMKAGYEAQLKSVVLLKNKASVLPLKEKKTVFIPKIYKASTKDWWGVASQPKLEYPVNLELVKKYYNVTEDPSKADFAIVFVTSPQSLEGGYDLKDRQNGSNGYVPISLQYGTYTATEARAKSIAAGDQVIDPAIKDRTYKNKTVTVANTMDLRTILDTRDMMNGKPVIVSVTASKPMIFNEFEKQVDGIVLNFGVSTQAVLDIISGKTEPSGLLPVQMPVNMETVEKQFEDVPYDMTPHKDSEGNVYDFAYGLNWKGVIKDARTEVYKK
ncbi:glycoside hydrolase family 3 protein [Flavobacterium piscisymbiosum]|uniref:beta-glucosidase n=1 Tax=Flavobacterium piscisymbiosum TaxID=2893753 RepID=A0ABS8MJ08_9FLAO|nr:glycoside hydrolase family 3 N-terminal domain-containing protein [Flavobacterium sp. F-30]MCC9065469.1 glycoside hydrolase family 3 C-terminal domain-containing protein [Flavobacterium sp. F-30]